MFQRPETNSKWTSLPLATRAVFAALVPAIALFLLAGPPTASLAAGDPQESALHTYEMTPKLEGSVLSDGALELLWKDTGFLVLRAEPQFLVDSRRRRGTTTFHEVVSEGAVNGHRGFSAKADDDGDGMVDEDPLDGWDNDEDGAIDEDFAAISDAMVAVHLYNRDNGAGRTQLEFYHWAYAHLRPAVFLNIGGGGAARAAGTYRFATGGSAWRETAVAARQHGVKGRAQTKRGKAFVSQVAIDGLGHASVECGGAGGLWVGVMVLDPDATDRISLASSRLEVSLSEKSVPAVVCTAESWLQLNILLSETVAVYHGMADPLTNRRAGWVVPPPCSVCRGLIAPEFGWRATENGKWEITAPVTADRRGLLDPDMFRIDGRPLGAPEAIVWSPRSGEPTTWAWSCMSVDMLDRQEDARSKTFRQMLKLLGHGAEGELTFRYPAVPSELAGSGAVSPIDEPLPELTGRFLDGKPVALGWEPRGVAAATESPAEEPSENELETQARMFAEDRARALQTSRHPPTLSPELLQGWPNPFNEVIRIRFEVPRTMEQAFVWKNDSDRPAGLDLQAAVPWTSGQPQVSVKIYTINGQELVTLHSGSAGVGEYSVQWNGTDAFGRQVASGTYFCKLQLDDWSVTRRLVYLR